MISRLPQILPKQNTDFVYFLCTNILNWPLNLHGKKKSLPCQNTDRNHWSNGIVERSKSKCKLGMQQSGSNWQHSDPMAYRHRQNDSTLAQWCWGIQWGQQSYFRVSVPLLITTLLKCSGRRALIGAPSSWGRSRRPPSLPMPRNGTACG